MQYKTRAILCVCVLDTRMYAAKTAEPIEMPDSYGHKEPLIDGGPYRPREETLVKRGGGHLLAQRKA